MKIAIVTRGELPIPNVKGGGVETLITALIKENEKSNNEMTVFSVYDEEAIEASKQYKKTKFVFLPFSERTIMDRIRARLLRDFPRESPLSFSKIAKIIEKEKFDKIVIEHSPWQFPFFVKKFGKKVSLHLHNDWINNNWSGNYAKRLRKAINDSNGVITISKFLEKRIMTLGKINSKKINLLYNATDVQLFSKVLDIKEKEKLKKELGFSGDDIVLIYSGRLCREKGVLELINAFNKQNSSKLKLLIVGSVSFGKTTYDEYTDSLAKIIEKNSDRIKTTGYVAYEEMYRYYAIADIQVIPSVWEEPFGLVAIEGMCQGLPIICTNSGGLPEVVDDSCSIIIDMKKINLQLPLEIEKLTNDFMLRKNLGENSRKRVLQHREYCYKEFYNKFIELI